METLSGEVFRRSRAKATLRLGRKCVQAKGGGTYGYPHLSELPTGQLHKAEDGDSPRWNI
jgi:hypothetical protein